MKTIKCRRCGKPTPKKDTEQRVAFCDECYKAIFGEDSVEFDELQHEINLRQKFINMVDNRKEDPIQTQEQANAEYAKYQKYEREIKELDEKQSKLKVNRFE